MTEFLGAPLNVCPSESLTHLILVLTRLLLAARTQGCENPADKGTGTFLLCPEFRVLPHQRTKLPFLESRGALCLPAEVASYCR